MMRTVAIFKNGSNRAIRVPRDMDFDGVNEIEIVREGDTLILRSVKPGWNSLFLEEKADVDFMNERHDIIYEERIMS